MAKIPFGLIPIIIKLLTGMFKAEKSGANGTTKKNMVLANVASDLANVKDTPTLIRWVLFLAKVIDTLVKLFNDEFGKNGWSELDSDSD